MCGTDVEISAKDGTKDLEEMVNASPFLKKSLKKYNEVLTKKQDALFLQNSIKGDAGE